MHKLLFKKYPHRILRNSLLLALLILLIQILSLAMDDTKEPLHAGAPTFTVCHATERQGTGERYFCSNDGCYSTKSEEMTVIGSYEDGNTCAGIAENFGDTE